MRITHIIDEIQKKPLICYGHASGIEEIGWSKKILKWVSAGRRKRGWLIR